MYRKPYPLCFALALAFFVALPAAAQRKTASGLIMVQFRPEASISLQGGTVAVKIRLAEGTQARLWVSDACLAPPEGSYGIAESGEYAIALSTLPGAGGKACLLTTDAELRVSVALPVAVPVKLPAAPDKGPLTISAL